MTETGLVLTSELLWQAAFVTALIDAPLLILAARWVPSRLFYELKWYLAGAAFAVYAVLWGVLGSVCFWEAVYQAIFPAWSRWLLPVGFGLLYGAAALAFWRASILAAKRQVVWFCMLGGLASLVGHSIGIGLGLLRAPMLAEVSAESALVFGVFEFIFYWCAISGLAAVGRRLGLRLRHSRRAAKAAQAVGEEISTG